MKIHLSQISAIVLAGVIEKVTPFIKLVSAGDSDKDGANTDRQTPRGCRHNDCNSQAGTKGTSAK